MVTPWSMTVMRSQMRMTRPMSCSMSSTVNPNSCRTKAIRSARAIFSWGFMPAAGSSSRSTLGLEGQRPGDLEAPLVAVGQVAGEVAGAVVESEDLQQLVGALANGRLFAVVRARAQDGRGEPGLRAQMAGHAHVVEHGQIAEEADVLEGPG